MIVSLLLSNNLTIIKVKNMGFKNKVRNSFRKARKDMNQLNSNVNILNNEQLLLKKNINEWILFLVNENNDLKSRIAMLEERVKEERNLIH